MKTQLQLGSVYRGGWGGGGTAFEVKLKLMRTVIVVWHQYVVSSTDFEPCQSCFWQSNIVCTVVLSHHIP